MLTNPMDRGLRVVSFHYWCWKNCIVMLPSLDLSCYFQWREWDRGSRLLPSMDLSLWVPVSFPSGPPSSCYFFCKKLRCVAKLFSIFPGSCYLEILASCLLFFCLPYLSCPLFSWAPATQSLSFRKTIYPDWLFILQLLKVCKWFKTKKTNIFVQVQPKKWRGGGRGECMVYIQILLQYLQFCKSMCLARRIILMLLFIQWIHLKRILWSFFFYYYNIIIIAKLSILSRR